MPGSIGELCSEIMGRNPLATPYSVEGVQEAGSTSRIKWERHRPPAGAGWGAESCGHKLASVPRLVGGKRIAVIGEDYGTIEALVVGSYRQLGVATLAVAKPGSFYIKVDARSGEVICTVQAKRLAVDLTGRKVVGLTRGEISSLLGYATTATEPQNL